MAVAFVQSKTVKGATVTFTSAVAKGDLILCAVVSGNGPNSNVTITDNASNTWIRAAPQLADLGVVLPPPGLTADLFFTVNRTAKAANAFTVTVHGTLDSFEDVAIAEFSGWPTGSAAASPTVGSLVATTGSPQSTSALNVAGTAVLWSGASTNGIQAAKKRKRKRR